MRGAVVLLESAEQVVQAQMGGGRRVAIDRTQQLLVRRGRRLEIEQPFGGLEGGIQPCVVEGTAKSSEQVALLRRPAERAENHRLGDSNRSALFYRR